MPNYLEYKRSISQELLAVKDRVRYFVSHWPEDGHYKEVILKRTLQNHLPSDVGIGTGFIIGDEPLRGENQQISTQIDIILYKKSTPLLFQIDDFIIVPKEGVLGIIEVKTNLRIAEMNDVIEKAHRNGALIDRAGVFNGIFSYEQDDAFRNREALPNSARTALEAHTGYVNNFCFGKDLFARYWGKGAPKPSSKRHYSFYGIEDLAFGYFISNLVEDCYVQLNNKALSSTLSKYLYPIEPTKERHIIPEYEIELP